MYLHWYLHCFCNQLSYVFREFSSNEMAEELARADELRRKEADRLRSEMEDEKKAQGNSITQMFDRLKGENENRKMEIHGENRKDGQNLVKTLYGSPPPKRIKKCEQSGLFLLSTAECNNRLLCSAHLVY